MSRSGSTRSSDATSRAEEPIRVGEVELSLLRPAAPDALIDEEAFAHDEFLPYWAELWPAASALAAALPASCGGVRVVELGCGLGVPSLVAARAGRVVIATDWASDAIELLRRNAERNGSSCGARCATGASRGTSEFDLALAADVLYEQRNVEPVVDAAPRARAGGARRRSPAGRTRPSSCAPLGEVEEVAPRVVRFTRAS